MTDEYIWVRRWGRLLGSMSYYIEEQVRLARLEKAPPDAIFRRDDHSWATVDEVVPLTREALERLA